MDDQALRMLRYLLPLAMARVTWHKQTGDWTPTQIARAEARLESVVNFLEEVSVEEAAGPGEATEQ